MMPFVLCSKVDLFRGAQGVFKFDTETPHRAVSLGVSRKKLGRAKIVCSTVFQHSLCALNRMRAICALACIRLPCDLATRRGFVHRC